MVALYYASSLPVNAAASEPLKLVPASLSPTHLPLGRGSVTFIVDNLRWPVVAVMTNARWGKDKVTTRAVSGEVSFSAPNAPQQLHTAPGANETTAVVQWVTKDTASPRLRWGSAPDALTAGDVAATTSTYTRADLCGAPAATKGWTDPGALHRATVTGLARGGPRIFFEAYDGADPSTPPARGSYTPPPPPASPTRILYMADVGAAGADGAASGGWSFPTSRNTSASLAADAESDGFRGTLIVHGGDVSYAHGFGPGWDAFFNQFSPATASAAYVAAIGNHERLSPNSGDRYSNASDSGGECGVPFRARIASPGADPAATWWSLNWGAVHFLVFNTEVDFAPGSDQHSFVAADLAGVDRAATPWLVAVGHRPMYIDSAYAGGGTAADQVVAADLRDALEPLFISSGVDLTLAGHHHSYQRTCPTVNGSCVADGRGPVHVVAGHGGADLTDGSMQDPTPPLFRAIDFEHGYLRIATDADTLTVTAVRSADRSTVDEFSLRVADRARARPARAPAVAAATAAAVAPAPAAAATERRSRRLAGGQVVR
jgi:hypothetical protein